MKTFCLLALIIFAAHSPAKADDVSGDVSLFGDAVHVEFSGRQNWNYALSREGKKMSLTLPRMDEKTLEKLRSWPGGLVDRITIEPGDNNGHKVTFNLKSEDIDSFDYLTDQPSRLVIDFFKKKEEPKPAVASTPTKVTVPQKKLATKLPDKKSPNSRKPAGEILSAGPGPVQVAPAPSAESTEEPVKFGIFDGGDPDFARFEIKNHEIREDSMLTSEHGFYLEFPMLELEPLSLKELWETPPIYEIKPEDNDENKKARLLFTLFNKKRFAVFLKTLEFFNKDYPQSRYKEIVGYLEADVYYEMWKKDSSPNDFDAAISRYRALVEEFPQSPLAERTSLLVGFSYLSRGDNLGALKTLQRYTLQFKDSENIPKVKLAISDSLRSVKAFSDAIKVLDEVEGDPKAGSFAVTAAFKKGDVYFSQKDFAKAADEYRRALKKYPKEAKQFPNAAYNLAEALFNTKQFKESLTTYREFLNQFPRSAHGGYAMTRIGEILEILGADAKKVSGAYLESIFRYKGSDGAGVARIRVMSERMHEMKPKELQSALEETRQFGETTRLPKAKEFTTVMIADGYARKKEFKKAINMLVEYYQGHPTGQLEIFKNRIVQNIALQVQHEVENGQYLQALQTQSQYASTWLKNSNRIDLEFNLGQGFEKTGLHGDASEHYRKALNQLYAIKGTPQEKERRLTESLPHPEQILVRLAQMSWVQGDTSKTLEYLENIKSSANLTADEKIERAELASQVAIAKGQGEAARKSLSELVATWKGQPSKVAKPLLLISELDHKSKKHADVLTNTEKILGMNDDSGQVPKEIIVRTLELRAASQVALGKIDDAMATQKSLLDKFEDEFPLDSVRYQLGLLHFERGNASEAEKAWSMFKPDSVWARLAKEQTEHSKWKENYKKYINRIPAMSGFKEKK